MEENLSVKEYCQTLLKNWQTANRHYSEFRLVQAALSALPFTKMTLQNVNWVRRLPDAKLAEAVTKLLYMSYDDDYDPISVALHIKFMWMLATLFWRFKIKLGVETKRALQDYERALGITYNFMEPEKKDTVDDILIVLDDLIRKK